MSLAITGRHEYNLYTTTEQCQVIAHPQVIMSQITFSIFITLIIIVIIDKTRYILIYSFISAYTHMYIYIIVGVSIRWWFEYRRH